MQALSHNKAIELLESDNNLEKLKRLLAKADELTTTPLTSVALKDSLNKIKINAATDIVGALKELSHICSHLVTERHQPADIEKYPLQGTDELYDLLDDIRFTFKELTWAANDNGFFIPNNNAFNNTFGIS